MTYIKLIGIVSVVSFVFSVATMLIVNVVCKRKLFQDVFTERALIVVLLHFSAFFMFTSLVYGAAQVMPWPKYEEAPKNPQAFLERCQASTVKVSSWALTNTQELTISCSRQK